MLFLIIAILVLLVLLIVSYRFRATPKIALVSTGATGYASSDHTAFPIDMLIAKTSMDTGMVPLKVGKDITFRKVKHVVSEDSKPVIQEKLEDVFEELYQAGIRFYVGAFTTSELLELRGFAAKRPDIVIMTTSSTSPVLETADNIYRFVPSDTRSAPLYARIIVENSRRKKYVLCYDETVDYAEKLAGLLSSQPELRGTLSKIFKSHEIAESATFADSVGADLIILTDDPSDVDAIPNDFAGSIFMSDLVAFYPYTADRRVKIERMGIMSFYPRVMAEECEAFGRTVVGRSVSPFTYNILIALWYISDMYHAGSKTLSTAHITYQKLFLPNGDCALAHSALAEIEDGEWTTVAGATHNPYNKSFYYH